MGRFVAIVVTAIITAAAVGAAILWLTNGGLRTSHDGGIAIRPNADGSLSMALCSVAERLTQVIVTSNLPESADTLTWAAAGDHTVIPGEVLTTSDLPPGFTEIVGPEKVDLSRNVIVEFDVIVSTPVLGNGGPLPEHEDLTKIFQPDELAVGRWSGSNAGGGLPCGAN